MSISRYTKRMQGFTLVELMLVIIMIVLLLSIVMDSTSTGTNVSEDIQRKNDIEATSRALEIYYRSQTSQWPSYPNADEFYAAVAADDTTKLYYPGKDAVRAPGQSSPSFSASHMDGDTSTESLQLPDIDEYIYQPRNRQGYFCENASSGRCASYTLSYRTTADRTEYLVGNESSDGYPSVKRLRSLNHQ